jgi:hypothetical protein
MAKVVRESKKIVFGVRRKGKYKKSNGPKEAAQKKKYRGQGR